LKFPGCRMFPRQFNATIIRFSTHFFSRHNLPTTHHKYH
jgi:hypothetical protein